MNTTAKTNPRATRGEDDRKILQRGRTPHIFRPITFRSANGQADLIIMARGMLNDPYWPLHAAKTLKATISWPVQYERGNIF
jgi:2,4-dienoyl-CoA reductase-like NADH-dependent reductase (Old Yellow Enzyme family)